MTGALQLPPAFRLVAFDSLDSTNREAARLAARGGAHGTIVWAREQTAGRGRRGRHWSSPRGNLYCSLLLRPDRPARAAAQLGFAAGLALAEALERHLPEGVSLALKWPNDVLIDGRKAAGILLEGSAPAAGRLDWLVLGVGVNLTSFPEDADYPATSLAAAGAGTTPPAEVLERFAAAFLGWSERWHTDGFASLRLAWLGRASGVGGPATVRLEGETVAGRFAGLDESGALVLELDDGSRRSVSVGDVFSLAA
ncbi:MAG: biotin--[acetyl-CoA-carboxylase] ligase [Alphaproteobacteria bacterium]